ncbi:Squalene/phytoene synthase [Trema orientale]|uniref:Squalene/phytoene synthase n=1 Tax=Trema orientale TaxID=63057 RepID=A0A2P5EAX1_TREOI|nr:Squalene/phytoene synthase [Trema orientale]
MALVMHSFSARFWSIRYNTLPKNELQALPCAQKTRTIVVNCLSSKLASKTNVTRQTANYKPTLWKYDFVQSLKNDPIDQMLKDKAEKLEKDVKSIITDEKAELLTTLELIDDIQRLGLGLMECFFWTVGMVFEPQYSNLRKGLTKVTSFITVIDDVYDVYGTLDELELFTDAVERWDIKAVETLPDYMKICFLALYNTINDMVYDTLKEHEEYSLPYLTKAWNDMLKAFLQEKKWSQNKETPTFKDYIENGWMSVSGIVILVHTYFLMSQNITKQGLESLENYHNLLRWPSIIFRLCNDLGTSTAELERGETASSILCLMRETGLSEASAREYIKNLVEETWKKLNKEISISDSDNYPFSKPFVETAINLARIARCTYQHGDAHGAPDSRSKNKVLSLIIDPIK